MKLKLTDRAMDRRDEEIARLRAEVEALRAALPHVSKIERECVTLEDWRVRALFLESSWARCSQTAARLQGERDEARAEVEALRADAERYRWLRRRLMVRQMENMKGEYRLGIDTRVGLTYFDSPIPRSTRPESQEVMSAELDAAIDDARKA